MGAKKTKGLLGESTKAAMKTAGARSAGLKATNATRQEAADAFADNVVPIILEIRASGVKTKMGIALALNELGVPTVRGGKWHTKSVSNVLRRALIAKLP